MAGRLALAALVLGLWLFAANAARAGHVALALSIPSITGSFSAPDYPNAILISSLQITALGFNVTRSADADSAALLSAVGTHLGTDTALFYKGLMPKHPAATFVFPDVLESSFTAQAGSNPEREDFSTTRTDKVKLRVHDSSGGGSYDLSSSAVTISDDGQLVLSRVTDSSTAFVQNDLTAGSIVSADLLFYGDDVGSPPTDTITFSGMMITSQTYDPLAGLGSPETDTFSFTDISQPTPEPSTFALLSGGILGLLCHAWQKRKHRAWGKQICTDESQ